MDHDLRAENERLRKRIEELEALCREHEEIVQTLIEQRNIAEMRYEALRTRRRVLGKRVGQQRKLPF